MEREHQRTTNRRGVQYSEGGMRKADISVYGFLFLKGRPAGAGCMRRISFSPAATERGSLAPLSIGRRERP
jgi:hypothetical protein